MQREKNRAQKMQLVLKRLRMHISLCVSFTCISMYPLYCYVAKIYKYEYGTGHPVCLLGSESNHSMPKPYSIVYAYSTSLLDESKHHKRHTDTRTMLILLIYFRGNVADNLVYALSPYLQRVNVSTSTAAS